MKAEYAFNVFLVHIYEGSLNKTCMSVYVMHNI